MSQKLTLARYLESRGAVKSLTRIEAEAFGVPYPLVSGWPAHYGAVEITHAMLDDLAIRIASANRSTAKKARRGLDAADLSHVKRAGENGRVTQYHVVVLNSDGIPIRMMSLESESALTATEFMRKLDGG